MKNRTRDERRALTRRAIKKRQRKLLQKRRHSYWDNPINQGLVWYAGKSRTYVWGWQKFIDDGNRLNKWNLTFRGEFKKYIKAHTIPFSKAKNIVDDPDDVAELLTSAQLHKVMHPGKPSDPWDWD